VEKNRGVDSLVFINWFKSEKVINSREEANDQVAKKSGAKNIMK
jgi:hypothetical protein